MNYKLNKTNGIEYSKVVAPLNFIPNAYESFGFKLDIVIFEAEQQTNFKNYIDIMFPSKANKTIVDLNG